MRWQTVQLGEVVSPVSSRAGARELPVYSVTKHSGFVPSTDYFKKQVFSQDLSTYKVVEKGQFAYATIHLDEGSIGVAPEACIISPMYTVFSVDQSRVDAGYLIRLMKSPKAVAQYSRLGRGTAERRKSISLEALGRLEVHLPPLPEQRRIAAILDEADSLRTSSSHALAVARDAQESLARSAVADMRRSDGELVRLGDLLKLSSGKFLPKTAQHEGNVAVFGGNGQNGWHSESMFVEPQLIIGRVGALCGAVHLTSGPVWVTDNAFIASWDRSRISANHLAWQLRLANLNQFSAVSGQPSISAARIADVMIAIPDAGQQAEFAARLDALEYHAAGLVKRTETLNELFASLQHRAFRGEL